MSDRLQKHMAQKENERSGNVEEAKLSDQEEDDYQEMEEESEAEVDE